MRKKPKFKGSFENKASYCGEHLTGDHITSIKDRLPTVNNWKNSFTVQDLYSRLKGIYPQETKGGNETAESIHQFAGTKHRVKKLYSDNSGEISKALKKLGIMPHKSLPGEPQTNAVAERLNSDIIEGARANLIRAGLPACS